MIRLTIVACYLLIAAAPLLAETGYEAWLRYPAIRDEASRQLYRELPHNVVRLDRGPILDAARSELMRGVHGMLGVDVRTAPKLDNDSAIVLGTSSALQKALKHSNIGRQSETLADEEFQVRWHEVAGKRSLFVVGGGDRGLLYGVFALLRAISLEKPVESTDLRESPCASIRILNHWDNLDGSIERGYAGKSIFWENNHVAKDVGRLRDYARLMASVGINGCSINNVNADARLVSKAGHAQVWRDAICRWFMKRSGIADDKGRVGNYSSRLEAEYQPLNGYKETTITPWEAASGRGAVQLPDDVSTGSINFRFKGRPGYYDLHLRYFDEQDGVSEFKLIVAERDVDRWKADNQLPTPTTLPDAHSSIRRTVRHVSLQGSDIIRLVGKPDAGERAAVDYLEIVPSQPN
jgi:hypothetical protein